MIVRRSASYWYRVTVIALALALNVGEASSRIAAGRAVTLAWDPNPETAVAGYLVYVGTRSGVSSETYDVGTSTSFTYSNAVEGQRYYFAVAAYVAGPVVGPRSAEVSIEVEESGGRAATPSTLRLTPAADVPQTSVHEAESSCTAADSTACYTRRVRVDGLGAVTALSTIHDGRVLFVERGREVRILTSAGLVGEPALVADDADTRFSDVVADPAFEKTRYVFVGVVRPHRDGGRQLSVVRYREVQNVLGEGATVVAGLRFRGAEEPIFAVDDLARIYVAMPAGDGPRDPYAGYILRFNADGSVPAGSRASSPVLAHGYAAPTALAWDGTALWLAGADSRWRHVVSRLTPEPAANEGWPRHPIAADGEVAEALRGDPRVAALAVGRRDGGASSPDLLMVLDSPRSLYAGGVLSGDPSERVVEIALTDTQTPEAVAIGSASTSYVAVQSPDGTYAVIELSKAGRRP